jgi:DNA polymerase I-like protein with 3'-5' exonuclease and polymerase domains
MNLAIQRIADRIPFRGWSPHTGIVLQVHDELVVQVPESKVDKSIRILENEMPATLGGRMRIGCEAGASRIWTGKSYVPLEA